MNFLELIEETIGSIRKGTGGKVAFVNPTEIYNEGWITRLLVYQSIKEKKVIYNSINFKKIKNWTSEGLIPSPFIDVTDEREGYTHADIALGDFEIDYDKRAQIKVCKNASIFGIFEAKMGSNLSQGTTHAQKYNQASRNIACIAENVINNKCSTFFAVVAPKDMIIKHNIKCQLKKDNIINQIEERFKLSNIVPNVAIIQRANKCEIILISYEDWIKQLNDDNRSEIEEFYDKCKYWNKIDRKE